MKNAQERGFSIILASEVTDIRDGYPNITYNYMEKIERLVTDEEYPFGPDASKRIAPRGRCQWLHAFGGECRCTPKGVFTVSANNNRNLRMVIMELGLLLYYNLGRHEFMLFEESVEACYAYPVRRRGFASGCHNLFLYLRRQTDNERNRHGRPFEKGLIRT